MNEAGWTKAVGTQDLFYKHTDRSLESVQGIVEGNHSPVGS